MTLGSQGKYKKALLQFLADNMDYTDYMRGIDNLTPDQLTVLVEKAIHKIKLTDEIILHDDIVQRHEIHGVLHIHQQIQDKDLDIRFILQ